MIVPYYPEESKDVYQRYYADQVGHGIGVFAGSTVQRGAGIGSFLSGIGKSVLPLLKSAGKMVGKELLNTGTSIAGDLLRGKNIKDSASSRFKSAGIRMGSNLLNDISSRVNSPNTNDADSGYDSPGEESSLPPPPSNRQKGTKRRAHSRNGTLFRNVRLKA
jgi:hypothetical protein